MQAWSLHYAITAQIRRQRISNASALTSSTYQCLTQSIAALYALETGYTHASTGKNQCTFA